MRKKVAARLRVARRGGHLTEAQLEELENTPPYKRPAAPYKERIATLMAAIRELGHLPRRVFGVHGDDENVLATRLDYARRKRQLSQEQLAELLSLHPPSGSGGSGAAPDA